MSQIVWSIQKFERLDNTQDYILQNLDDAPNGFCVQALRQDHGKGRHGRSWHSPEGNLYLSFLLKPRFSKQCYGQMALVTGLSIVNALKPYVDTTLKWPNDVLLNGKKICGILIEVIDHNLIIGVGLNIVHAPISEAGSLAEHDLCPDDIRNRILEEFSNLYNLYNRRGFDAIRQEWERRSFDVNTSMSVNVGDKKISGLYQGLDKSGYLLLQCDKSNELITITSGDVFKNDVTRN